MWRVLFFSLSLCVPFLASAHVKWFAEPAVQVRPYSFSDVGVWIGIIGAIVIILIGVFLHKKLKVPQSVQRFVEKVAPAALSVASIGFGLAFIIFTIQGFIFAPNLIPHGNLGTLMLVLQGIAGVMMLCGLYERVGGFLLVILFALGIKSFGATEMLDTLEMLGFALYAMVVGRPKWSIAEIGFLQTTSHKMHAYGHPLLRVATGLNLIVLGFSEKILAPSLTADFLSRYDWNFMKIFGMPWFTDYWFAFSAGIAEMLFGIFFVLGIITRTTTIALAIFLCASLVLLGPVELLSLIHI